MSSRAAREAIDQMEALVIEAIEQHTLPLSIGHGARAIDVGGLQATIGRIARNLKRETTGKLPSDEQQSNRAEAPRRPAEQRRSRKEEP